jgi:hypothetical protein
MVHIIPNVTEHLNPGGDAIAPDYFCLNYIDHLKSDLNHYYIVLYDKDNLIG